MAFIIDSHGDIAEQPVWMQSASDPEVTKRLVFAEGHVWIGQVRHTWLAWLNPAIVSPPAEAALYYLLSDVAHGRIVVSFSADQQTYRILRSATEAIAAISQELAAHRRTQTSRFASRTVNVSSLSPFPALQQVFHAVTADDIRGSADLEPYLSQVLHNRYLIVQREGENDRITIRAIGLGYSGFDAQWAKSAAGRPLDEQPDIDYGTWLADGYRSSLASRRAVAEEVAAAIFRPNYGRRRFSYLRLLVPFTDSDGADCLLSTSVTDPAIDLGIN